MELVLSGDREFVDAARATALLASYPHFSSFTRISLRNKSYSLEAAQVLATFLKTIPAGLAVADLADMIAGRPEDEALLVLEHVCQSLSSHAFVEVDLSDNALGEKGVRASFGVLERQVNLERLYLCNNGLSAESAQVIADVLLFRGANVPTKLKTFHFYNNMSGDGGAKALATLFPSTPLLEDLRFSTTRSQREGCRVFAHALSTLSNLKFVDLSDNTFGAEGAMVLAVALAKQSKLEVLNLRDASIGDEGLIAIANALVAQRVTSLCVLDVSGNDLTEESMTALAKLLKTLPLLEELRVEENEIGSGGASILAAVLQKKSVTPLLRVFQSNSNELASTGGYRLAVALAKKPQLASVELDGNMFSDDAVAKITAALPSNVLGSLEDNMEDDDGDDFSDEIDDWSDDDEVKAEDNDVDELAASLSQVTLGKYVLRFDPVREVVDAARAKELLAPFQGRSTFHTISLRGKSYTQAGAAVVADFLRTLRGIKVADLADIIAGRPEDEALVVLTTISKALVGHVLDEIDLSDNALGEKGVRACFAVLIPQPTLKRLSFCNNGISAAASAVIAKEVVLQQDGVAKSLETFHFFNNMSGHEGCLAVASMLSGCPNLTSFRFASARAGAAASLQLAQSIGQHVRHLTSLDLSDCSFDDQGAVALAAAISKQTRLKVLKLRDASLGPEGAKLVVAALATAGIQLESLDLSGNELEDQGIANLIGGGSCGRLLDSQVGLKVLRLDENEVTSKGLAVLADSLHGELSWASALEELSLYGNEITASGAMSIVKAVSNKAFLKLVQLDSNMISSVGLVKLRAALVTAGKAHVLGSMEDNDEDAESDDGSDGDDDDEAE
ncbi:hypothetical protein B5M09_001291 [Aphanomyces astaci]|uniref:Ran-GTPase activating protein 1 C-terminal domain-containing protein n=1 Tax=Aphanomyces astaci TaxID=112090 RepID=A0A3R7YE79_APHAT|nr:hypothetical protein B5M09_001291 [Aphanomyces astaci]